MSTTEVGHEANHGHEESPQERHKKEHLGVWLFIFGDAVILALEIFFWFYLRTLNVNGMWIGAACSKLNPCTDGLGNPITAPIQEADGICTLGVAALVVIGVAFLWLAEVQARGGATRKATTPLLGLAVLFSLASVVLQFVQFQVLPFTTIDGAYASVFEFYMGSNVAHVLVVFTVASGLMMRSRKGMLEGSNWYQAHLGRLFGVWIAFSCVVLAVIATFLA